VPERAAREAASNETTPRVRGIWSGTVTFGLVSIEAFARKTPVIARDLGPLPEVVEDSGGGFVYRTEQELRDLMERIAASPRLRQELAEEGYDSFQRWWTKEAHLERYFYFLRKNALEKFGHVPWETAAVPRSA
jgi:glycosyltransferase involved in cell wall biosynthesis